MHYNTRSHPRVDAVHTVQLLACVDPDIRCNFELRRIINIVDSRADGVILEPSTPIVREKFNLTRGPKVALSDTTRLDDDIYF